MSNLFQKYFVKNSESVKKGINGDLQSSFAVLFPEQSNSLQPHGL